MIINSITTRGYIRKYYLSALAWEEYWNFEEGITNAVAEIELLKERNNISRASIDISYQMAWESSSAKYLLH